ncbi:MAG TPA: NAD-dependent epimerase/dehydratase family protein [Vicinamibacterales bacterium]|nr:NAD-dependent epimerase/dehydratase family protein [Vicinamibacterales bacterium]
MPTRIVVTGSTGFLGRHLMPILQQRYRDQEVIGLSSRDYDLSSSTQADRMIVETKPDAIVHLAGYSGGIGANRAKPADFYYRNTLLTAHVFQSAASHRVRTLIYTMGGCSYPASALSPIDEQHMWDGYPFPDSAAYSMAKKMALVAADAYRTQYGLRSVVLVPGNMYGPYDNFRRDESHVIPAMIRRLVDAVHERADRVTMWGSGNPVRDYVYAGDVAANIPFFLEHDDSPGPVNLASGTQTRIRDLAECLKAIIGFDGQLCWDTSKPEGQDVRTYSVERMTRLGLSCPTPLRQGLEQTVDWFRANYAAAGDGLRI